MQLQKGFFFRQQGGVQRIGPSPQVFVNISLINPKTHKIKRIRALCDSGNTLSSGSGISRDLAVELGATWGGKTVPVGTARKGAEIRSLGTCGDLLMEVAGLGQLKVTPTVLQGLSHAFNIGAGCLRDNQLSLDFRGSTPTLRGPQGTAPMISVVNERPEDAQTTEFPVTIATDQTLRPGEATRVLVTGPPTEAWDFKSTINNPRVVPVPGQYGSEYVFIRNLQPQPVTIRRGKRIGQGTTRVRPPEQIPPTAAQLQELWTRLRLDDNAVLKARPAAAKQLRQILHRRFHVFSRPESKFGRTVDHEMSIRLQPGTKPIRQKLRPLNPEMSRDLKTQLDSWLAAGVVQPSRSAWASPLVPVRKKDGTTRWAVDYRRLNAVTLPDAWPIPNVSELLMRLGGSRYFSSIDAVAAYHTIPLDEASRELTAFVTPYGLYEWLCMPFGLCNAGGEFTRFIEGTLREIPDQHKEIYIDDNLLHTWKLMHHLLLLDRNFEAYEKRGIKIGPEKTDLLQTDVQFLGHRISEEGIAMIPSYINRILQWPAPTNPKELNSMLGFFGYYADHIVNYGTMTAEMNSLKKVEVEDFKWTQQMDHDFKLLKDCFKEAPIRAFPQWNSREPFLLQTDFSGLGLGAVLSQVQDGAERLIAASSRKATKYERNYSSFKGELAALVYGIRKFHHMLVGRNFVAITDHAALKHLDTLKDPRGIAARWIEELAGYQFSVQHKAGVQNSNADGLSRAPQLDPPDPVMENEEATYVGAIGKPGPEESKSVHIMMTPNDIAGEADEHQGDTTALEEGSLERQNLIQVQKRDPVLRMVRTWTKEGPPPKEAARGLPLDAQRYIQVLEAINTTRDGLLVFIYKLNKPSEPGQVRALVPEELKEQVFLHLHVHPMSGHFGVEATKKRARTRFYYPGMCDDIAKAVTSCTACLAKTRTTDHRKGVAHKPRRTGYPMQVVYLDLVGPLPVSSRNSRYILTMEDAFTRWVQAVPIPNKEAATVAKHFVDKWVYLWGTPVQVHSDNGKEFTARCYMEVMKALGIKKTNTPPYNPQSNPVERFHRSLHSTMRVLGEQDTGDWEKLLPVAAFAYNTKAHSATGLSPHYALLGREARLPVDLLVKLPDEQDTDPHDFVKDLRNRFREMHKFMRGKEETQILRNSHAYDEGTIRDWNEGQLVWYFLPRKTPGRAPKHTSSWTGPWAVVRKVAKVLVCIKPANQAGAERIVHASRLREMTTPRGRSGRLPEGVDLDSDDDEEPTRITNPGVSAPQPGMMMPEMLTRPPRRLTVQVQNTPEEAIQDKNRPATPSIPKTYPKDTVMEELPTMPVRVYEPEAEDDVVMAEHMETDRDPPRSITDQGRPLSVEGGTRPKAILHSTKKKMQPYRSGTLQKILAGVPARYPTRGTRASPMEVEMDPIPPRLEIRGPVEAPPNEGHRLPAQLLAPGNNRTQLALPEPDLANTPQTPMIDEPTATSAEEPEGRQHSLEAPPSRLALQYQPTSPTMTRPAGPLPVQWEGQEQAAATQDQAAPAGHSKRARSSTSEQESKARWPAQKQPRVKKGQRQRASSPPNSPVTSDQDMMSGAPTPTRKPRPRSSIFNQAKDLLRETSDSLDALGPTPHQASDPVRGPAVPPATWSLRSATNCTLAPRSTWRVPTEQRAQPVAGILALSDRDNLLQRGVHIVERVTEQHPGSVASILLRNEARTQVRLCAGERIATARIVIRDGDQHLPDEVAHGDDV